MTNIITIGITWALTALVKNSAVDKYNPNRLLLVRLLAALFALLSAVLMAFISHNSFDTSLIGIFVEALIAWLGAIGVYHAPKGG